MPQEGFGQQRAAFLNKLRRYARMHTCTPWSLACPRTHGHGTTACLTTHHFYLLGIQQRASPVRDDNSHSAKARIFLILALPTQESPWSKASRRPHSQERRTRRKELLISDLVRRKQRLVTAKQFSLPRLRSDSVVRRPWKGAQTSCHQQNTQEAKRKMLPRTWRRLPSWVDARLAIVASAAMMTRSAPASQLIWRSTCTTRHEHSFWARASRIVYGHIQTKLTFICCFSLNPPPPPPPLLRTDPYSTG